MTYDRCSVEYAVHYSTADIRGDESLMEQEEDWMTSVRILLDSISPAGARLTTVEARYQRFIHSEIMTYRMLSRNTSSSRAIPTRRLMRQVWADPALPVEFGRNRSGMQAGAALTGWRGASARWAWSLGRYPALGVAAYLHWVGVHKQVANRVIEPWMWITAVLTGSPQAWENVFRQRCHPDAQPEFQALARLMQEEYRKSEPVQRTIHTPFILTGEKFNRVSEVMQVSIARCARVSYEAHDGTRSIEKDLDLYSRLLNADPPHSSPFEHVAYALDDSAERSGNLFGWRQHRADVDPYFIE